MGVFFIPTYRSFYRLWKSLSLKLVPATFLLVWFLSLNESTCETKKNVFFFSFQKLFSFSRKSNFRILHFQISWCHQMPKHKTRNRFHWITWEVNRVCERNLASACHIAKEKNSSKNSTKTAAWKLVPDPFVFAKNWAQLLLENKIFKAATYTKYVKAKLSKFVQTTMLTSTETSLQRILWKLKRGWNQLPGHIIHKKFW